MLKLLRCKNWVRFWKSGSEATYPSLLLPSIFTAPCSSGHWLCSTTFNLSNLVLGFQSILLALKQFYQALTIFWLLYWPEQCHCAQVLELQSVWWTHKEFLLKFFFFFFYKNTSIITGVLRVLWEHGNQSGGSVGRLRALPRENDI